MTQAQEFLLTIVADQHRGLPQGIPSICSANPWVIEAALLRQLDTQKPVLIESTSNQVNQYGGYTGMTPAHFHAFVKAIASKVGFPIERILLGGDHLGPNPWQQQTAEQAMEKARQLVADCVQSGYTKIHLDASMRLSDDTPDQPLDQCLAAKRAAELAEVAEATCQDTEGIFGAPVYVIGTEVPHPGGIQEKTDEIKVTDPMDLQTTIETTRSEFFAHGLQDAWSRVIAVVVQPGVEFGDAEIFDYDRAAAKELKRFIEAYPSLVYEAHSTDYQTKWALKELVEDHFAILKVGPALTFAFREAIFSLAIIEEELLAWQGIPLASIRQTLDAEMLANPEHWEKYYNGDEGQLHFARKYSLSDRSRYYWPAESVQKALEQLLQNLSSVSLPLSLLSQFLPVQYEKVRRKQIPCAPVSLILDRIQVVLEDYDLACNDVAGGESG